MHVKQVITADELWAMPEVPGVRFELVEGELIEVPGATLFHGLIAAIVHELIQHVARQQNLGIAVNHGVAYLLRRDPDTVRVPDVSFLAWDRVPDDVTTERTYEGAPTLAVEIASPDNRARDLEQKARDYLDAGTLEVWILWPKRRSVSVSTAGSTHQLDADDELASEHALPGFRVRVSELFNVPARR